VPFSLGPASAIAGLNAPVRARSVTAGSALERRTCSFAVIRQPPGRRKLSDFHSPDRGEQISGHSELSWWHYLELSTHAGRGARRGPVRATHIRRAAIRSSGRLFSPTLAEDYTVAGCRGQRPKGVRPRD